MVNISDRDSEINSENRIYISLAKYLDIEDWKQAKDMYENAPEITQKKLKRFYWKMRSEESREDTHKTIEELKEYEELTRQNKGSRFVTMSEKA